MRANTGSWRTLGALGLCLVIGLACSSSSDDARTIADGSFDRNESSGSSGEEVSSGGLGDFDDSGGDPSTEGPTLGDAPADPAIGAPIVPPIEGGGNAQVEPGTLTAGAWDDNRNLDRFLDYRAELYASQMAGLLDFDPEDHRAAAEAAGTPTAHATLDVALVIDTTGSMGDELAYLQSEFDALSLAIEERYPLAEQRWALVVYRDSGDAYVARAFDFVSTAAAFRSSLEAQSSAGGGDIPEASDAALEAMNQLSWRSDESARLAFWVADAPHHQDRAQALSAAIRAAQGQGVHLYPVASSGVDELTELSMRSAAQLTLGRYLFLTDDSGVGNDHKEPSIPCYFVTRLNDAILRMVDIEMTGVYREPDPMKVIRAGGDPSDGACLLSSGQTVFAF